MRLIDMVSKIQKPDPNRTSNAQQNLKLLIICIYQYVKCLFSYIQFGCCRPPVECGFEAKNATWWTVPATSTAEIKEDCKTWSNTQSQLCYSCETCKVGVYKGIRKRWRILLVFNLLLILLVVLLYSWGCCVRKNNRVPWKRRFL